MADVYPIHSSRIVKVQEMALAACPSCGGEIRHEGSSGYGPVEILGVKIKPQPNWWKGSCVECRSRIERHLLGWEWDGYVATEESDETYLGRAARELKRTLDLNRV